MICVGALNDGTLDVPPAPTANGYRFKAGYSNYGERVDVFAPTDLPYMPTPPKTGPGNQSYQIHGGTSASAPFVSGVVAMMKAINPDLNAVQVANILRSTSQPGLPPPGMVGREAKRIIDALAAVRAAASGIPIVPDRFEPHGMDVGVAANRAENDLNISGSDLDPIRFAPTGASEVSLTLDFAKDLGPVSVDSPLIDENGECPPSVIKGPFDTAPPIPALNSTPVKDAYRFKRAYSFSVSGGAHRAILRAPDINGYNMQIAVTPATVAPDSFENNDTAANAALFGFGWGGLGWQETTGDASIHSPSDTDFYIIRGLMGHDYSRSRFGIVAESFAAFRVWGNESPITLAVYEMNPDGSVGKQVGTTLQADACAPKQLVMRLAPGGYYYAVVNGAPGRYRMSLGTVTNIHLEQYLNLEDAITRPGPVEIRGEKVFVLPQDPAYEAVTVSGQDLHLSMLDAASGGVAAEGRAAHNGERLELAMLQPGRPYLLRVRPRERGGQRVSMLLSWQPTRKLRTSDNILTKEAALGRPVELERDWIHAASRGRVKATLSTRMPEEDAGIAGLRMVFMDAKSREVGATGLVLPGAAERRSMWTEGLQTSATLPPATAFVRIESLSAGQEAALARLADTSLTLTEYDATTDTSSDARKYRVYIYGALVLLIALAAYLIFRSRRVVR